MALSKVKRVWNGIWNTLGAPIRISWAVVYGWLDAVNTVATLPKQAFEIISSTTSQIKDVFSNARNKWKRYNKLVNVPLSPFLATWTAIEWAVRAVVHPTWNAITHTKDVAGNILINAWNSLKRTLSDKPMSDFRYEHLKTNPVWTKNYISNFQWYGGVWSESKVAWESPKATPSLVPSEKELFLEEKIKKMEEDNKNLKLNLEKSLRTQEVMKKQQEETNKQLFSTLSKIEKTFGERKKTLKN
jgi:hypothetical protein